jgi:hypothetical protein
MARWEVVDRSAQKTVFDFPQHFLTFRLRQIRDCQCEHPKCSGSKLVVGWPVELSGDVVNASNNGVQHLIEPLPSAHAEIPSL